MTDSIHKFDAVLVVPCYNEEQRLDLDAYASYLKANPSIAICFVNDGSKDRTGEVLQEFAVPFGEQVLVLQLEQNSGKAEAVRQGVLECLNKSMAPVIGYWDADLATPLDDVKTFLEVMDKTGREFIMGCRLARLGSNVNRGHLRHYIGRIMATLVSILLRQTVYDTQCGAKLISAKLCEKLFSIPFRSRWLFDVELLKRLNELRGHEGTYSTVYEYALESWEEVGDSKVTFAYIFKSPFILCWLFMKRELERE